VLVLESNHDLDMLRDGPYPWPLKQRVGGRHGHLSNDCASRLLQDVVDGETMVVALAHLSETNNEPTLAATHARSGLDVAGHERVPLVVTSQHGAVPVAIA
jgi:phosphoribosyl 1,2-cyclic phosphodiesterase